MAAPFSSSDLTSADYPTLGYSSGEGDLTACINNGSSTTAQDVICKGSDATTISWGSAFAIGFGTTDYDNLSLTMSVAGETQMALLVHDASRENLRFATVPENLWPFLGLLPFWLGKKIRRRSNG